MATLTPSRRTRWVVTFGSESTIQTSRLKATKLQVSDTPQHLFLKVQEEYEDAFLLESAKGATRLAEYSFIGFEPAMVVRVKNGTLELFDRVRGSRERIKTS